MTEDSGALRPSSRHRRSRTAPGEDVAHRDRWIVSYADFITLLFAFFTTMYAISTVDAQKLSRIVMAMQSAFDSRAGAPGEAVTGAFDPRSLAVLSGAPSTRPVAVAPQSRGLGGGGTKDNTLSGPRSGGPTSGAEDATGKVVGAGGGGDGLLEATLDQVRQRLMRQLASELARGDVEISIDHRGLVISVPEAASFTIGSADLSPAARELIARIASQLLPIANMIRIEGHTDDVPIRTARYASNWELSTARATNVVAFLIQQVGLPAKRLSAAGYGEFKPRAPNDSSASRARNRRVDIVVLDPSTRRAEEPGDLRP